MWMQWWIFHWFLPSLNAFLVAPALLHLQTQEGGAFGEGGLWNSLTRGWWPRTPWNNTVMRWDLSYGIAMLHCYSWFSELWMLIHMVQRGARQTASKCWITSWHWILQLHNWSLNAAGIVTIAWVIVMDKHQDRHTGSRMCHLINQVAPPHVAYSLASFCLSAVNQW